MRPVELEFLFRTTVVDKDIEAPGSSDQELMAGLERMTRPHRAAGNVVQVENSLQCKRYVFAALNESQIAARVVDARQLNDPAIFYAHNNVD